MAMRESDGLRIATMIFFLLVVILAGTTYMFFSQFDEQRKKSDQLERDIATATNGARISLDEIAELKRVIGSAPEDTVEQIKAQFEKDMGAYGATFPEESRFYRPILESMSRELSAVTQREAASVAREQDLKGRLEVVEVNKDKQIDTFKQGMDKIAADAADERSKFNDARNGITQNADKLAADLQAIRNEKTTSEAKSKEKLVAFGRQIEKLEQLNKQKNEMIRANAVKGHEQPAGRITWVNQRDNVVWINLGQADALKRQTSFAVYPVDANNMAMPEKKGSIEITRILDQHMAEARIVEDEYSNPILPGDQIHSSVWAPGRRDSFALVGFMDVDGDKRSDRDKIRDLILLNGGVIDLELLDSGELKGKLNLNTRYIVLGDSPGGSEKNAMLIDNFSRVTGEAQELGIETISVSKFVDQMGWTPDERTVQLGRGARPSDFKATFPNGVQRRSYGSTSSDFQKRARPLSTF